MLRAAEAVLPDGDLVTDPDIVASYRHDRSTGSAVGEPIGVAFPRTADQVSAILSAAHEHRVPVVPRGAGSGLSGGSNAVDGSLVVCVERMRDVLEVNVADGYVETEPGVINQDLRDHVSRYGLWYAPDPASKDFCSIGGNVNTNAGGLCCVKYGVTREAVLEQLGRKQDTDGWLVVYLGANQDAWAVGAQFGAVAGHSIDHGERHHGGNPDLDGL